MNLMNLKRRLMKILYLMNKNNILITKKPNNVYQIIHLLGFYLCHFERYECVKTLKKKILHSI